MKTSIELLRALEKLGLGTNTVTAEVDLGALTTRVRNNVIRSLRMCVGPSRGETAAVVELLTTGASLPMCRIRSGTSAHITLPRELIQRNREGLTEFFQLQLTTARVAGTYSPSSYRTRMMEDVISNLKSGKSQLLEGGWGADRPIPGHTWSYLAIANPATFYDLVIRDILTETEKETIERLVGVVERGEKVYVTRHTLR